MGRSGARGVVLILISALLALIAFLVVGMLNFGRLATQASLSTRMKSEASLAMLSGLDYAAARLWQDWRPVYPRNSDNACDDWTAREESITVPFENVVNPSYSHGDASGRLRGSGASGQRFLLRVASHAGLVCINSGELGSLDADQDGDGILNGAEIGTPPDYQEDQPVVPPFGRPNDVKDWQDVEFEPNVRIVNMLNNLGVVAGLAPDPNASYAPPFMGAEKMLNNSAPYAVSDLGRRVVSARPRGGYDAIEELRPILGADYEKVAPYLSTRGEIVSLQSASGIYPAAVSYSNRLDFNVADRKVIEATLRYLSAGGDHYKTNPPLPSLPATIPLKSFVRILSTEAARIAKEFVKARPLWNWRDFLQALVDMPDGAFEDDPFVTLAGKDPAWDPAKEGIPFRRRLKEDLILTHMDIGFGWEFEAYRNQRRHLDVEREGAGFGVPKEGIARTRDIRYRQKDVVGGNTFPFFDPTVGLNAFCYMGNHSTLPFGLAPHRGTFRLECRGWTSAAGKTGRTASATCTTDICLGEELRLSTQIDFEQFMGWTGAFSAPPRRYPGGILIDSTSPEAERTRIQSWPFFPATTFRDGGWFDNGPTDQGVKSYQAYYTSDEAKSLTATAGSGWLELGARQWDYNQLLMARGVFPFNEDGTPVPGLNEYSPADALDNLLDPIDDVLRVPDQLAGCGGGQSCRLNAFSPMGPLGIRASGNNCTALWMQWAPPGGLDPVTYARKKCTPFEREPFSDPSVVNERNGPTGAVKQGTIGFWAYVPNGETPVDLYKEESDKIELKVYYFNEKSIGAGDEQRSYPAPELYLTLLCDPVLGAVQLMSSQTPAVTYNIPLTEYTPSGWQLIALTFEWNRRDPGWGPDDTAVVVWVDGKPLNDLSPFKVSFNEESVWGNPPTRVVIPPLYDEIRVEASCFDPAGSGNTPTTLMKGFDDLFTMKESLKAGDMHSLLMKRREQQGSYRSSRFKFDPALIPSGGYVAGYAWDSFIPESSAGILTLRMTAYDDTGAPSQGPEIPYIGDGPQAAPLEGIGGISREFDWQIGMTTGNHATPILDEFRIFYTPGRAPRRGAIATR